MTLPRTPPPGESNGKDNQTQNAANNTGENDETNVRRSKRTNKGVGPDRYDYHVQKELNKDHPAKSKSHASSKTSLISRRSNDTPSINSRNSNSSSIRASKQLEIELKKQEELANLERQQIERERQIIELRARLEAAKLNENTEYHGQSKASNASERSVTTIRSSHSKVVNWLQTKSAIEERPITRDFEKQKIEFESARARVNQEMPNVGAPRIKNTYMARQAIGKDLPTFKGSTADWILFERIFNQTTEACGFSEAENMLRLQKCLQGDALESVRALLMTTNVDRVMSVLRRRFGRSEHIIEDLMHKVIAAPNVKEDRPITMIRFAENVANLVATIESLRQPSYLTNPLLIKQLVCKLPALIKMAWGKRTARDKDGTCLRKFAEWVEEEAEAASAIYQPDRDKNEKRVLACREEESLKCARKNDKCLFCGKMGHKTEVCYGFLKLSVDDRWVFVKKKRVCFGCLAANHSIRNCNEQGCEESGCSLKHHTLLHNDFLTRQMTTKVAEKSEPNCDNAENDKSERVNCTRKEAKRVYLRILPVTLRGPAGEIDTFALLDGGSTVTLISEEIADKLGLSGPLRPLIASWYDNTTNEDRASREVNVDIRGVNGRSYNIRGARTTKMSMPGQTITVNLKKWPHLIDIDIPDLEDAIPTIMIGEDNLYLKKVIRQVTGKVGNPYATLTPLGWTVHGPDCTERPEKDFAFLVRHKNEENELNELVRDFWTTESFGVTPTEKILSSKEDLRAREVLQQTMRRVEDRWEVGLLWKTDHEELPDSYETAKKRLISIENKMLRDPVFGEKYSANIQAYIDKGYARELNENETKKTNAKTWYLPHFAAYNPQKPDKLRMVFDAAAKNRGVSLNDRLLKGPDLLKPLPGVLFRFREKKIAICGDLREMFHQVRVRKEDQSSQRFLWRDKVSKEIITLEMRVMIFGAISSPFVAHKVRDCNAEEYREQFPEAYDAIVNNHYVDDYLDSLDTVEEAVRRLREVTYVHKKGGFEMRNLMTNSTEVRATLNPDFLAPTGKELTLYGEDYTRVLGVNWAPETDSFFFSTKFLKRIADSTTEEKIPTKREVLKILMSLFDPLGLLASLTIRAKILLQDIWREGTGWDEEVTKETSNLWHGWLKDLQRAEQLRIPRHYLGSISQLKNVQLHIFCDASIQAFAAVAYLRLQENDNVQTMLVMAKTRVAPIKLLTVPRLELQSAVMATRLAAFIQKEHNLHFDRVIFWSDSQTALGWIKSDARKYQPFVAHRIAEILDSTSPTDWRWVPTDQNVADEATRSKRQDELENSSRWFQGPKFLCQPETKWPLPKIPDMQSLEIKKEMKREHCFMVRIEPPIIDSSRFSSWTRLIRVVAWVLRFSERCRGKSHSSISKELTGPEIQRAEDHVIKQSQQEAFTEEWEILQRKTEVPSKSRILSLSPIFKEGFIRMDGRVVNKDGSTFQPVILDGQNHIVKLMIAHHHRTAGHHGRETLVNDLRQRFWITNIRMAVRRSWNDCLECRHRRAQPTMPRMAPLPPPRLQDNVVAFTDTGVDYFGPIQVTIGRRREKRYGVLFTCLTVRAIHLEIAASLDTDSMIMALRRMMARRGKPKRIYSDNGTNLRGACEELRKVVLDLDKDEILRQTSMDKIEWHFIPPGSPHMGGCWERLIGSVKRALKISLKECAPRGEVLQTLFAEAEYSINSRPLTYVSDDPECSSSLTPNDFLGLTPGGVRDAHGPALLSVSDADKLRRQWRYSQWLANHFWKRWIKEYLPSINRRAKWHRERPELRVDDLVVIWDENAPRNQWRRGRVTAVYPGRDGRVRVADVRTATGTLRRSVAKLCVLEIS